MQESVEGETNMVNDQLGIIVQAILDTSNIGEKDFEKIKKIAEKYTVDITAKMDTDELVKSVKSVLPKIISEINSKHGLKIPLDVDDKLVYKTVSQLEKNLEKTLSKSHDIKLSYGDFGKTTTDVETLITNFKRIGDVSEETQRRIDSLSSELKEMNDVTVKGGSDSDIVSKNDRIIESYKALSNEYKKVTSDAKLYATEQQRLTLANTIEAWNQKNTRATKECINKNKEYIDTLRDLGSPMIKNNFDNINQGYKSNINAMREANRLGKSFADSVKDQATKFSQWVGVSSVVMEGITKVRQAGAELKNIDSILTEISKTSDLTKQQLKELGAVSFDAASKYGKKASDYLIAVQEMSRSGFYGKQGEAMAEQAILAVAAGDLYPDVANNYILATNAAYKLNGEAEKLNAVLDGQNSITNKNSVAMSDMAVAMSEAGTVASSYRVSIEDLSAMIGTIESVTKLGGGEVGNAIKAILINLQNVTSDKIVDTLDAANASMTEFIDGAEKLRNPIDILRDLATTFNQLDEDDPLRAEILTNIGQKYHASKLSALLQNMDMYDKMLVDYSQGSGSAMEEASKSANNWEGSLNKAGNAWNGLIDSLTNQDAIISAINGFTGLLKAVTSVTDNLGLLKTVGLGVGIFEGFKHVGEGEMQSFHLISVSVPTPHIAW